MSYFQSRLASLILLVLLTLPSPAAFALGLGNVKVESFLNQPLDARIDLLVRPGEDISGVTARLASADDYALIGASRDSISVPLRFTIDTQSDQPFVRVTSSLPVNQPIVRLIIELNWASGRLLREYTLFLDPPTVPAAAPPPVIDERRVQAPVAVSPEPLSPEITEPVVNEIEPDAADSDTSAAIETDEAVSAQVSAESEYGPVQSGDTLWRIASNWSGDSTASVNQVMLAIQRNNPQAFINNNINLLKRGAILRMPSSAEVQTLSATEARSQVQEQSQSSVANSTSSASTSPPTAATAVETPLVDVASEMSSSTATKSVPDDAAQLEIVPPSEESIADSAYGDEDSVENASASTSVTALQEELARKEEALITEQQTNEYLQQRIRELESRVESPEPAKLQLEDEELADMEARLREQRLAPATESETVVQQATPARTDPQAVQTQTLPEQAWYSRWTTWVIGLLVLLAAGFGWFRSRSGAKEFDLAAAAASSDETVRGIKGEAEEILKVLKPAAGPSLVEAGKQEAVVDELPAEAEDIAQVASKPVSQFSQARHLDHEEAYVLDEDSADPEVRLDLARAYISMGDREAARAILGEVVEHGDAAQQAEAKSMLSGL